MKFKRPEISILLLSNLFPAPNRATTITTTKKTKEEKSENPEAKS
jgi:hypothetical protein